MDDTVTPADAPLPNGMAKDVPVLGTEPVKAKRKRRTKAEMEAARKKEERKRAKKAAPTEQTSTLSEPPAGPSPAAAPVEEAPTPSIVQDVGAPPSYHTPEPQPNFVRFAAWAAGAAVTIGAAVAAFWGV